MRKDLTSPPTTKRKLLAPSKKGMGQIKPKLSSVQWIRAFILVGNKNFLVLLAGSKELCN